MLITILFVILALFIGREFGKYEVSKTVRKNAQLLAVMMNTYQEMFDECEHDHDQWRAPDQWNEDKL